MELAIVVAVVASLWVVHRAINLRTKPIDMQLSDLHASNLMELRSIEIDMWDVARFLSPGEMPDGDWWQGRLNKDDLPIAVGTERAIYVVSRHRGRGEVFCVDERSRVLAFGSITQMIATPYRHMDPEI